MHIQGMDGEAINPEREAAEKLAVEYGSLRLTLIRTRLELQAAHRAAHHFSSENEQLRALATRNAADLQTLRDQLARIISQGSPPQ